MTLTIAAILIYAFKGIYINTKMWSSGWKWTAWIAFWGVIAISFFTWLWSRYNWMYLHDNYPAFQDFLNGTMITLVITCVVMVAFNLIDDIAHFVRWIAAKTGPVEIEIEGPKISRWRFISQIGLGAGALTLGSFFWGITKGKLNFSVVRKTLSFPNLPAAFDGAKIVQISDAHLGSFTDQHQEVKDAIQTINDLNPDYIFFTGDLVNSTEQEADPWVPIFKNLCAKKGMYAILGNHDYGYYGDMDDDRQAQVRVGVIDRLSQIGFKVLLNEHTILREGEDKIGLIGVENWGKSHWFPKAGDLAKAKEGLEEMPFNILLSHDPTHWEEYVIGKEDSIDLTLSGHTHGAQMGLHIPGVLYISPARLMFKRWAGLYQEGKNRLYINRGFGYLIFPGRVGMSPENSLLELKKA